MGSASPHLSSVHLLSHSQKAWFVTMMIALVRP